MQNRNINVFGTLSTIRCSTGAAISRAIAHISGSKLSPPFQWIFNALSYAISRQNVCDSRVQQSKNI